MTATDTERELRDFLRADAEQAARSFDVDGGLYRWRTAVLQRRSTRRRTLAVVSAAAAVAAVVSGAAWTGAWFERHAGQPSNPGPTSTHVRAMELGTVTIETYSRLGSESGYFTLSVPAGVIDQGIYRANTSNPKVEILTGTFGVLNIRLGDESITPPPDRVGTRYAWTVDSATGAYAGVSGGGVATALTTATGPVITWELTGTLARAGSLEGSAAASGPLQPGDVLISSWGAAKSPRGDGTFALALGTGITDTGSVHMIDTPRVQRAGTTSLTRSYDGALGSFQMQLTFAPTSADGTTLEQWTLRAGTGRYAGLVGSGTGTFSSTCPVGPSTQEDLRGALTH